MRRSTHVCNTTVMKTNRKFPSFTHTCVRTFKDYIPVISQQHIIIMGELRTMGISGFKNKVGWVLKRIKKKDVEY